MLSPLAFADCMKMIVKELDFMSDKAIQNKSDILNLRKPKI